jgi:hypothetical protein
MLALTVDERYDVTNTARLIRAIDRAFMLVKSLERIKAGLYLFLII